MANEWVLRPNDEVGDTIRVSITNVGWVRVCWWDGMTDFSPEDFRWLIEEAGPAIMEEMPDV